MTKPNHSNQDNLIDIITPITLNSLAESIEFDEFSEKIHQENSMVEVDQISKEDHVIKRENSIGKETIAEKPPSAEKCESLSKFVDKNSEIKEQQETSKINIMHQDDCTSPINCSDGNGALNQEQDSLKVNTPELMFKERALTPNPLDSQSQSPISSNTPIKHRKVRNKNSALKYLATRNLPKTDDPSKGFLLEQVSTDGFLIEVDSDKDETYANSEDMENSFFDITGVRCIVTSFEDSIIQIGCIDENKIIEIFDDDENVLESVSPDPANGSQNVCKTRPAVDKVLSIRTTGTKSKNALKSTNLVNKTRTKQKAKFFAASASTAKQILRRSSLTNANTKKQTTSRRSKTSSDSSNTSTTDPSTSADNINCSRSNIEDTANVNKPTHDSNTTFAKPDVRLNSSEGNILGKLKTRKDFKRKSNIKPTTRKLSKIIKDNKQSEVKSRKTPNLSGNSCAKIAPIIVNNNQNLAKTNISSNIPSIDSQTMLNVTDEKAASTSRNASESPKILEKQSVGKAILGTILEHVEDKQKSLKKKHSSGITLVPK